MSSQQPVLFVSHGGGPLPLLGDPSHQGLIEVFQDIRKDLMAIKKQPQALLFISAHWEASPIEITALEQNHLYYDYFNFPLQAYEIGYPAPSAPDLAQAVQRLLEAHHITSALNYTRGLDHGVFVPAKLLFPEAKIPCFQISLQPELNAENHILLGKALQASRAMGVLIIGSGFSFHNMQAFMGKPHAEGKALNLKFEQWLRDTLTHEDRAYREAQLENWERAPGARYCHPREEHLMPLLVCAGVAATSVSKHWECNVLGMQGSCYWWT
ncbi:MAG: dioxygenase [Idiomarina sp.]|nr:dioxygenase [Idiomarina sp.]